MLDSFCVYTTLAFSQMLSALWFLTQTAQCSRLRGNDLEYMRSECFNLEQEFHN